MALQVFAAWALLAAAPLHSAPTNCTQETLTVQNTPLTVVYCVTGPARRDGTTEIFVPFTARYSARGASAQRAGQLHFLADEGVSRVLSTIDLTAVNLVGTLHLTLAYSRGLVHIEGALLTPGAITIK
ncbi:MAG: hypothetical protein JO311_08725 [Candidatus Eremiobacteraeota bacterium]|nr:hypothetical protein [Candidatus Eremiobacteraeota bacterium]MBV9262760.1 hypothetical protein [Candidatus Eremiobacteraeota bacterium]